MYQFEEWRGYDISKRCKKIENAFKLKELRSPEDFPTRTNNGWQYNTSRMGSDGNYYFRGK